MKRLAIPTVLAVTVLAAQGCTQPPPAPDVTDAAQNETGTTVCEYREPVDGSLPCYSQNVPPQQFCVLMSDGTDADGGLINPRCQIVG